MKPQQTTAMNEYRVELAAAQADLTEAAAEMNRVRQQERSSGDPLLLMKDTVLRDRWERASALALSAVERLGDPERAQKATWAAAIEMLEQGTENATRG